MATTLISAKQLRADIVGLVDQVFAGPPFGTTAEPAARLAVGYFASEQSVLERFPLAKVGSRAEAEQLVARAWAKRLKGHTTRDPALLDELVLDIYEVLPPAPFDGLDGINELLPDRNTEPTKGAAASAGRLREIVTLTGSAFRECLRRRCDLGR